MTIQSDLTSKNKVCAVTFWYNPDKIGREEISRNINSYLNCVVKLYLYDNSDYSNADLVPTSDKIEYIPNKQNLGISAVLNLACKKAIDSGYKWILAIDQDSYFEKEEYINRFIDCIDDGELDKSDVGILNADSSPKNHENDEKYRQKSTVITSGSLINLDVYQKLEGFDENLFIDEVDLDYSYQLSAKNFKIYRITGTKLTHKIGEATLKKKFLFWYVHSDNHSAMRKYYMAKNACYMAKKYHKYFPKYMKKLCKIFIGVIFLEQNKKEKLSAMLHGIKDFCHGRYGLKRG